MNYTVMSKPAIQYLCSVINQVVSLPTDVINNINLADNLTFSNIHIKNLIDQCLIDANDYADQVVNALTHLVAEKIDFEPTLDNTTDKLNTLLLYSKNNDNNYTQYLRLTNELLNLGDTSLSLTDYLKITDAASTYTKLTDFKTLSDEVAGIKTKIGTETLTTTATTLTGAINEISDKSAIITLKKDEYEALAPKDPETYYITSDDMTMYKGESQVLGGKPLIGKETVLYEGNINAAGTYTLADNVNNYDFIIINYTALGGTNAQTLTMSKIEISKCIDAPHCFMCVYGYAANDSCITGYFNNEKLILNACNGLIVTSIVGYKFGEVTVQNTITNPSPAASYSTDEQLTGGTWIDGKPIYRKVIDFGALPNSTLKQVPHGISDIDAIVSFNGVTFAKNKTATPIPYVYTDSINTVSLFLEGTNVCIQTFGDKTSYINTYVTLEYTKTTD